MKNKIYLSLILGLFILVTNIHAQCPPPGGSICVYNNNSPGGCMYYICPHYPILGGTCPNCTLTWSSITACCITLNPGNTYCFNDPTLDPCFGCLGLNPHDVYWDITNISDWTDCSCMPCDGNGNVLPSDVVRIYLDSAPGLYVSARSHIYVVVPSGGVTSGVNVSSN